MKKLTIAIQLDKVSFKYDNDESLIINQQNFELYYGEFIVLTGASGCGKSTLINLITGIIPNIVQADFSGNILINNVPIINKEVGTICRDVGLVLQNPEAQIFHQIVEDEIAFGCENFGFDQIKINSQIEKIVNLMHLNRFANTHKLSGGQKQKLITGAILATEQKIIILDEPLANLDRKSALELLSILHNLVKEHNYAVLMCEHRLDALVNLADHIYELKQGIIHLRSNDVNNSATTSKKTNYIFMESKAQSILNLQNVHYSIKNANLISEINLEIHRNERLVILGDNGAGKTTLLRLMSKIIKPSKGNVIQHIDHKLGQNKKGNKQWFKKIGIVYQNPNYQLFMPTVRQELEYNAINPEITNEIIEKFNFHSILDRHPHSLSEGQKRKLTIAAVLTAKPDIIFLDEPTVGQDSLGLNTILNVLSELENTTIVTVTHDEQCAYQLCDRAIILENGTIANQGGHEIITSFFTRHNEIAENLSIIPEE